MPTAELTVLGSGTCAATAKRSMAGYHLAFAGKSILLDIGDGTLRRMLEAGIAYPDVDAIFISHHHIDHVADLVPYLWAVRYSPEVVRCRPLYIVGPPGTNEWYERLASAYGDWLLDLPFSLIIEDRESESWEWQGIPIETRPMYHSVPVNGYRFDLNGTILVYTGDTGYHANVVALAQHADWLMIECSFLDDHEPIETHLTPAGVGRVAGEANVKRIILTHLYPECDRGDLRAQIQKAFAGPCVVAEDLLKIAL